ncbi:hypothetical protein HDU96_004618 [Phlyctochytrium bullatum]|nr:hypothetical protein HDU96_004618 [Phlyctochytrium bullatum]
MPSRPPSSAKRRSRNALNGSKSKSKTDVALSSPTGGSKSKIAPAPALPSRKSSLAVHGGVGAKTASSRSASVIATGDAGTADVSAVTLVAGGGEEVDADGKAVSDTQQDKEAPTSHKDVDASGLGGDHNSPDLANRRVSADFNAASSNPLLVDKDEPDVHAPLGARKASAVSLSSSMSLRTPVLPTPIAAGSTGTTDAPKPSSNDIKSLLNFSADPTSSVSVTVTEGCDHPKPRYPFRLVCWHTKRLLEYCGTGCDDAVLATRRLLAVSHAWGEKTFESYVQGLPWTVPRARDKSIEKAFIGVREDDLVWLDILCVNQRRVDEVAWWRRSLREVYARAAAVVLWLHDGRFETPWPMLATVRPTREGFMELLRIHSGKRSIRPPFTLHTGKPLLFREALFMLLRAISDPWFQRIWTTLEVGAAQEVMFQNVRIDLRNLALWIELFDTPLLGLQKEVKDQLTERCRSYATELNWDVNATLPLEPVRLAVEMVLRTTRICPLPSTVRPIRHPRLDLQQAYLSTLSKLSRKRVDKVLAFQHAFDLPIHLDTGISESAAEENPDELERLWTLVVIDRIHAGDESILRLIAPGPSHRTRGLWHPILNVEAMCKQPPDKSIAFAVRSIDPPPNPAAWQIETFPYWIDVPFHPTSPAILRMVRVVSGQAVWSEGPGDPALAPAWTETLLKDLQARYGSTLSLERSREMIQKLSPFGECNLEHVTDGMHSGVMRLGRVAVPFWMPPQFVSTRRGKAVRRVNGVDTVGLTVRAVLPGDVIASGRMRVWLVGAMHLEYPGVVGAAWIDFSLVHGSDISGCPMRDLIIP